MTKIEAFTKTLKKTFTFSKEESIAYLDSYYRKDTYVDTDPVYLRLKKFSDEQYQKGVEEQKNGGEIDRSKFTLRGQIIDML